MLDYNEIKRGKVIVYNDEPYRVMENRFVKKNRNKATNQAVLKSLISGKSFPVTFRANDNVEEAEIEKEDIKFLYQKGPEVWFCAADNPKDRFNLDITAVENQIKYLKQNDVIRSINFNDQIIGLDLPAKVELVVTEAPDAVKGNTSSGATKKVVLENGLEIFTPLFVENGDIVVINTETGEYSERKKV